MSSAWIRLGVREKLKPFSRRRRVGGSRLSEERLMTVDGLGLEEGGAREERFLGRLWDKLLEKEGCSALCLRDILGLEVIKEEVPLKLW